MTHLSYTVNTMVDNELATQGATASTVMVLNYSPRNIPAAAPKELT